LSIIVIIIITKIKYTYCLESQVTLLRKQELYAVRVIHECYGRQYIDITEN